MFESILEFAKGVLPFVIENAKDGGAFLMTPKGAMVGVGIAAVTYILERLDNNATKNLVKKPFEAIAFVLEKSLYGAGVVVTTFFGGKFKLTKPFWEKLVEPYIIDLLDNLFNGAIEGLELIIDGIRKGLFAGLRSDNKK